MCNASTPPLSFYRPDALSVSQSTVSKHWRQWDIQTDTHTFNSLFSRTTRVSRNRKGKTSLDFTGAWDSERQWHQLGHMQVCTWPQTDNHASTAPLSFLQAGCPSCRPTNSVKALKANIQTDIKIYTIRNCIIVMINIIICNYELSYYQLEFMCTIWYMSFQPTKR